MAHWKLLLRRLVRQIWFRITLFCLGGFAAAFAALLLQPYIPENIALSVGADSVGNILGILAASMLTVTTFSLTTMVSAFASASSNLTPRATQLLMEDTTAHNALATFLGAFLYSIVGIVALSTGTYGSTGRLVLLAVTILVIIFIVVTLLRWIGRLTKLGTVRETIEQLETAASSALAKWCKNPHLRAAPRLDWVRMARAVYPCRIGYVQHIDVEQLAGIVDNRDVLIDVDVLPGTFVDPTRPIAYVDEEMSDEDIGKVRNAFLLGDRRTYEQDPRFGLIALSEVASRALSPAINDPGTAIDVINAGVRVLALYSGRNVEEEDLVFPKVRMPPLSAADMMEDFFVPIARDGAGLLEVGIKLQKALRSLSRLSPELFGKLAEEHSEDAMRRAGKALDERDLERVRRHALNRMPEQAVQKPMAYPGSKVR
ncbi:DUF2254 domain-containing protein [Microvirga terrestris]|uniref:DUF2254 domain-containing protein n=1 Tax=Microvirga terrestris TaxID=2791024 RepID=A0ABS0HUN8_9HYPH|nr:DUF2254 domain-containing protein [Microvirga terrestris]MBF9196996.1 DUF2254 domain-containing protein [Microvirga terrestris]